MVILMNVVTCNNNLSTDAINWS